jgi:glucose/mannose-6-phosphate isomerase
VSAYRQAVKNGARALLISTGGALTDMARKDGIPYLHYQYSSPPRYAVGFTFSALLAILNKLGVIDISPNQIREAILLLQSWSKKLQLAMPQSKNPAKQLAAKLIDRIPVIISQIELTGIARVWKTHFNESAKTAAYTEELPDANHYAVSGTKFPKKVVDKQFFVIIQSKYSQPRLKIQENLFMQSLDKSGIGYEAIFMHPTNDSISETYLNILFAEYGAYYLAILNKINPFPTPAQDFIKQTLLTKD